MDVHDCIQAVSKRLSRSTFEKRPVAEGRLLMQPLDGFSRSSREAAMVLDQCEGELNGILVYFSSALSKARSASKGDSSSYDRWLDAWASSPVSTRLLHAMQTLLDGCIFQVRQK